MNKNSMITVAVERYLTGQGWHFEYDEEQSRFTMTMSLKKIDSSRVYILIGEDYVLTYALMPNHVPESKRDMVCRYIARGNYGLRNGNLEMDLEDGEVRYKTYLFAKDRIPLQNEIERYIDISFLTLDRYAEGIMKIIYGDMDDKTAVDFVEK